MITDFDLSVCEPGMQVCIGDKTMAYKDEVGVVIEIKWVRRKNFSGSTHTVMIFVQFSDGNVVTFSPQEITSMRQM